MLVEQPFWDDTDAIQLHEERFQEEPAAPTQAADGSIVEERSERDTDPIAAAQQRKVNQLDAMKQALADLGLGAKNADLAQYLNARFGFYPRNISVLKSQAKKALFKAPQHPEALIPADTTRHDGNGTHQGDSANGINGSVTPVSAAEAVPPNPPDQQPPSKHPTVARPSVVRNQHPDKLAVPPIDTMIFDIDEVLAVKRLCDRIGAATVLDLMDILGR
jgi:hypothetical protein